MCVGFLFVQRCDTDESAFIDQIKRAPELSRESSHFEFADNASFYFSLSVHSFHNDSPPLAPADSSRRYSQDHRWTQGGSHGSLEELPALDLLSESVEESSGYASGSEESASKHLSSSPPLQSLSGSSVGSIPIPPNLERREQGRPLHASPDSRPPAKILQRSMDESDKVLTHSNSFGMSGSQFLSGHVSSDDMKDKTAGIPIQATSILDYEFPRHRLPIKLRGEFRKCFVETSC